jgi:hypothetical protein
LMRVPVLCGHDGLASGAGGCADFAWSLAAGGSAARAAPQARTKPTINTLGCMFLPSAAAQAANGDWTTSLAVGAALRLNGCG